MRGFINDDSKRAFGEMIESIEAESAAEVVVAVRHHSGSYLHADVLVGLIAMLATTAFLLYSPYSFSLWSFLVDPPVVGLAFAWLSSHLPMVRRWLSFSKYMDHQVTLAARSAFFEKNVRMTSGRTGILVFISLLERRIELVADKGVVDAVDAADLEKVRRGAQHELRAHRDGIGVAKLLTGLGAVCAPGLPHSDDDIDELPNEVCA